MFVATVPIGCFLTYINVWRAVATYTWAEDWVQVWKQHSRGERLAGNCWKRIFHENNQLKSLLCQINFFFHATQISNKKMSKVHKSWHYHYSTNEKYCFMHWCFWHFSHFDIGNYYFLINWTLVKRQRVKSAFGK